MPIALHWKLACLKTKHSQIKPRLLFGESFTLSVWYSCSAECLCSPHLGFVVFEQPFGSGPTRVVGHVQDHHALLLPANERTVRHSLHHGQEVLVAVVPGGHHGEGGPVVLLEHLEDNLELERGGAGELEVDGAAFLNAKRHTMNSDLK